MATRKTFRPGVLKLCFAEESPWETLVKNEHSWALPLEGLTQESSF